MYVIVVVLSFLTSLCTTFLKLWSHHSYMLVLSNIETEKVSASHRDAVNNVSVSHILVYCSHLAQFSG
jgi:hypothetical protein